VPLNLIDIVRDLEAPSLPKSDSTLNIVMEVEKLASLMETNLDKFADGVRSLANDLKVLKEKRDLSENIALELVKRGEVEPKHIFSKTAELEVKPTEELKIIDQALKMSKSGQFTLGSISEKPEPVIRIGYGKDSTEALETILNKVKGE
jgi:hypothetical protein